MVRLPETPKNIDMFKVFWKQLRLQGTTMGSAQDFTEMLTLVESGNIQPLVDKIYPLAEINQALDVMKHSSHSSGKLLFVARTTHQHNPRTRALPPRSAGRFLPCNGA